MPTMMFKVTVTHQTGTVATLYHSTKAKVEELREKIRVGKDDPDKKIFYTSQRERGMIIPQQVIDIHVEEVDVETELKAEP